MKKRTVTPVNVLLALVGFLFLTSLSVTLVLNFRGLYYFDIDYLNLAEETGYSEEVIRENYDALIDYNLITNTDEALTLPDFPVSETGGIHFQEVKQIFVAVQILGILTGIVFLVVFWARRRLRDYGSLKLIPVFSIAIPAVLGIAIAVNWDAVFVEFHEIFFQNDYWLFNPATDPVILILPDEFFAHCAVAILILMVIGGLLSLGLYWFLTKRAKRPERKNKE